MTLAIHAHDARPQAVHTPLSAAVRLSIWSHVRLSPDAPAPLQQALRQHFTLPNPLYRDAVEHGRSTRGLSECLTYYHRAADGALLLPRGAVERVYRICCEHGITVEWDDRTHLAPAPATPFAERVALSPAQEQAVQQVLRRRVGVLEAPAGSGKTVMGLALVARRQQPALWIVHTKELLRQAIARAGMVLGLEPGDIGVVGDGRCTVGERLTVALVQTLAREIPPALLRVGHVIVDEAHHAPAEQVAGVIAQFPARYRLGLTATPYRRDGLDAVIRWYLGPVVARMDRAALAERLIEPRIIKRDTNVRVWGDSFTEIVSALVVNRERNALIAQDVIDAVREGRRCLVLSDRTEHVEALTAQLTAGGVAAAALHGQLPKKERQRVVEALNAGTLGAVVATGALVGEGFDCPRLDALFLATPVSYEGRLVQYLGRVSRSAPGKRDAVVFDYCDDHPMLWSSWGKRGRLYRQRRIAA